MNPIADALDAYVDLIRALAIHIGLLSALTAAVTVAATWAIRRAWRRAAHRRALTRLDLDAGRDRLRAAIRDAERADSIRQLEELYHAPEARTRNTH